MKDIGQTADQAMKEVKRVAIYARVSTQEQTEGYSIAAQLDLLRSDCKAQHKVIFEEYVDPGVSGKSIEGREALKRLLRDAAEEKFDEVVVWKINRVSRRTIDLLHIVEILDKHNITFRSYSEKMIDTESAGGKFLLQMLGSIGELERNTIVDNVKMGMKQRARTGAWNGGRVLGYESVRIPGEKRTMLKVVPEEAVTVKKIFERFVVGKGLKAIANQLNYEGYKTKKGNAFSTAAVKHILTNPLYVGKIQYNKFENWSERRRKGKTGAPIVVDGSHEAIIPVELWERVQALRKKKSVVAPRQFDGRFILTGLIRCPQCGGAMVGSKTQNRLKDGTRIIRRYYACGNFKSKGSAVCSANSIRADYAEDVVLGRIREMVDKPGVLRHIVAAVNKRRKSGIKPLRAELAGIEKEIAKLTGKKRKYFDLYEDDVIDKELFIERIDDLNEALEKQQKRKTMIERELEHEGGGSLSYAYVKEVIGKLDHVLQETSAEQTKALLRLMIKQISLNDRQRIDQMELVFDETVQKHFLEIAPSGKKSDGAFALSKQKPHLQPFRITI